MLATLPTYLARAKRSKRPLPIFEAHQFPTAEIAVAVAEDEKSEIGLLCSGSLHLLRAVLSRASVSKWPVIVIARCGTADEVRAALSLGVGAASIPFAALPKRKREETISELEAFSAAKGAALTIEWPAHEPLPASFSEAGIDGILLTGTSEVNGKIIEGFCEFKGAAVFLDSTGITPRELSRLMKKGARGYFERNSLEEAYAAGLRTGLRNRSASLPSEYGKYADKAVEHAVRNVLNAHN